MRNFLRIAGAVFAAGTLFLAAGCSGKTPDPPKVRSELVLEIFRSLEQGDYAGAEKKIQRLRSLDPTNVFLSDFESVAHANARIAQAEKLLKDGKRDEAEKRIRDAVFQSGNSPTLAAAADSVTSVIRMESLVETMREPRSSYELESAVGEFTLLARKLKAPPALAAKAEAKLARIPSMRSREFAVERLSLEAEGASLPEEGISYGQTLHAVAEGLTGEQF